MSTKPSTSTEPFPFPTSEKHDTPPEQSKPVAEEPTEEALDNGVEESFPASDPVSVTVDKVVTPKKEQDKEKKEHKR
jgi:hypothetical protein